MSRTLLPENTMFFEITDSITMIATSTIEHDHVLDQVPVQIHLHGEDTNRLILIAKDEALEDPGVHTVTVEKDSIEFDLNVQGLFSFAERERRLSLLMHRIASVVQHSAR